MITRLLHLEKQTQDWVVEKHSNYSFSFQKLGVNIFFIIYLYKFVFFLEK